jgi:hypothetical protein
LTDKENQDSRRERFYHYLGIVLFIIFGILAIYGYHLIDTSETFDKYLDVASRDPSGFRFTVFVGILQYGLLLLGISLLIVSVIVLMRQKKK